MKQIKRTKGKDGLKPSDFWRTPPALFEALDREFAFELDLAANAENHLVTPWLGPGGLAPDALAVAWAGGAYRVGFCNPPYSSTLIAAFMAKGALEAAQGFTSVFLVPYTVDTVWWSCSAKAAEIREIPHRVGYTKADGKTSAGAMFGSAIVVFRPQPGILSGDPRRVVWDYQPPTAARIRREKAIAA